MRFLLVSPPKKGIKGFYESPPIGLGYLATALRSKRHSVVIKDCIIDGWTNEQLLAYIGHTKPEVLGITLYSTALASVKELLSELRKQNKNIIVILGGPHVTGSPEHTLKFFPEADFGFRGEAEIPMLEFLEYLCGKRKEKYVHGLVYRSQGKILFNDIVEYQNIEDFGFPAWDLIDPRKYFKEGNVGRNSINVHFSRGCPFECKFCVKLGTKVRFRGFPHIWEELDMLHAKYGVERFVINDEGFTMLPNKVVEFCKQAIESKKNYRFFTATGLRLNRLTDEMLSSMREANFEVSFGVGIESAVPRVRQELMNKKLTQEELDNGLRTLKRNGYRPVGNFIIGFPGTTLSEDKESVKWAINAYDNGMLHGANWVPFLPLPGSPIVNKMLESGELSKDYDFSKINLNAIIYAPKGTTIKDIDNLKKWAVWKFNTRPKLLLHYLRPGLFFRAVVTFMRIYLPNWMLPKDWRRL